MRKVWKFSLALVSQPQSLLMPEGAKIRFVGMQGGYPQIWAEVWPDRTPETRTFYIVGTGHDVHDDLMYVGTVMDQAGLFMWHIFEDVAK